MNRIAAQNARDRKKNYVEDLERRVTELEAKVCAETCAKSKSWQSLSLAIETEIKFHWLFHRIRNCSKRTSHSDIRQTS